MDQLLWNCRTCGIRVNASQSQCSNCGYQRTEFDVSWPKKAGDTGKFIAIRMDQPSFSELAKSPSRIGKKVIIAFAMGTTLALVLTIFLRNC